MEHTALLSKICLLLFFSKSYYLDKCLALLNDRYNKLAMLVCIVFLKNILTC